MWYVYTMQREYIPDEGPNEGSLLFQYRVGITRNIRLRCEQQRVVAGWVLQKEYDKIPAKVWENLFSSDYSIPQLSFVGSNSAEQCYLNTIWNRIDSSRNAEEGLRLIEDYCGSFENWAYVNYERTDPANKNLPLRDVLKERGLLR